MKSGIVGIGKLLLWIGIGVVGATLYGILNDQITVTLSPEYFSVFKRAQFGDVLEQIGWLHAPIRLHAVLVGTLATWWFGLFLGIALSMNSLLGRRPPLSTWNYLRAVAGIMAFTLALSMAFGVIGYLAEPAVHPTPDNWPFLEGIDAVRPAFAIGFWHDGAYLGGFLGTFIACFWAQWRRRSPPKQNRV